LPFGREWFDECIADLKRTDDQMRIPKCYRLIDKLGFEISMSNARIVLTTAGSQEEAGKIARALVERRLAACVNIVPQIESVYRWKDNVETATEWLLLIKTQAESFERVRAAVKELHSYDLPECVMLEVAAGSQEYLDWIAKNTI
jgi:periplasmic divalent cation tolerance protein